MMFSNSVATDQARVGTNSDGGFSATAADFVGRNSGSGRADDDGDADGTDPALVQVSSQEFDNTVRENIIFLIFFLTLIGISSMVIDMLSRNTNSSSNNTTTSVHKREQHHNELENPPITITPTKSKRSRTSKKLQFRGSCGNTTRTNNSSSITTTTTTNGTTTDNDDESVVKRICTWVCTLTLSTSIGATLLLPISIISNEVLLLYPTNMYLEWLNGMLIQGLWNLVFLFSNIGLFLLLPFAHLFIESEGFSGKRGLMSKLQESAVILTLLTFMVWGIAVVVNSFFVSRGSSYLPVNLNQLPFIYSFISFVGVLVFTLCTPLGLSHMFTVLSDNFVFVPEFLRNLENEHVCAVLEYENLKNRRDQAMAVAQAAASSSSSPDANSTGDNSSPGSDSCNRRNNTSSSPIPHHLHDHDSSGVFLRRQAKLGSINDSIDRMKALITQLESLRSTPPWKRNLLYPGLFLSVLSVTGLTVFIVLINAVKIVVGFRDLTMELVAKETLPLGGSSLSFLGPSGAIFEIILVMYLITTCVIGLYNLPWLRSITPSRQNTPASHLIYNCAIVLVLSSALPVFMRILGLTNFDLLGTYAGKIDWIENTLIVVSVNLLFSILTCVSIINKVTRKISHEIIRRLRLPFRNKD